MDFLNVTPFLLALDDRTYEAPQSSSSTKEEPDDTIHEVDSPRCSSTCSRDRRDSLTSNETHESFESCQSSPWASSALLLESRPSTPQEDHHDLKSDEIPQSDLECLHDIDDSGSNEQHVDTATFTLPADIISVTPPDSPIFEGLSQFMIPEAVNANIQSSATSTDKTTDKDPIVDSEVNPTLSSSSNSTLAPENELNFDGIPQSDLECLHDIDASNERYNVDPNIPATNTLPVDIIPLTPLGSPIFELEGL